MYEIDSSGPKTTAGDGCFQIDPSKGKIFAKCVLDREQKEFYRFKVCLIILAKIKEIQNKTVFLSIQNIKIMFK